jgi:RNA polymerase sigma-70 factor, ECF subfamily
MDEGERVLTGGAILNAVATIDRSEVERSRDQVLEGLVREHSRLVYRIAYAVLRSHPDAEDSTQETFLRVLRYSSKLAMVEEPKKWLSRIAWRVAVDRSRRRARTREIPLEDHEKPIDVAASEAPADEAMRRAQIGSALEKLIAALPAKLRHPLVLATIEEMSPREVGATLGINEAAVRSRIFRARQILKEKLAQPSSRK